MRRLVQGDFFLFKNPIKRFQCRMLRGIEPFIDTNLGQPDRGT